MKGRWLFIVIAANLVVTVALAFVYPHLMVSPGALVLGHSDLATDCFACHAPLRGAASSRCIQCHATSNFEKCVECHRDPGREPAEKGRSDNRDKRKKD